MYGVIHYTLVYVYTNVSRIKHRYASLHICVIQDQVSGLRIIRVPPQKVWKMWIHPNSRMWSFSSDFHFFGRTLWEGTSKKNTLYQNQGYMHHGFMHNGYIHHGWTHGYWTHSLWTHAYCIMWAPDGRKGRSQGGLKGPGGVHKLLIKHIYLW